MSSTKVVNIDSLTPPPVIAVEIGGKRHTKASMSLGQVIETIEDMEAMARPETTMADQLRIVASIVLRSFPTLTEKEVMEMPEYQMNALFDVARGEVETEESDERGNEQPAG